VDPAGKPAYGRPHARERAKWAAAVARGEVKCRRCLERIAPGANWDLGHDDLDRSLPALPEHRRCNRATAGRQPEPIHRRSREW
jgi:hypothetical protein